MQLTNVTFPVGVEIIGASAFQNNLFTTVNFPNTVININSHAFSSNQIGPTLTLPDSVETIVANSFYNNQPLVTVYIGTGLKTYGSESYNVFADIQGLPDGFDDPMGCASMNRWHDPFRLCINLEKIIVNVNNQNFKSINDNLYNKAGTWIVRATKTTTKIAYGTIGVNEYAFADLEINSILAIPDTLKYLASNSFDSFKSDKTIIFPNSLKIISTRSFYNTDVTISIGNGLDTVFSHCFDKRNTITINKKASQVKYYKNACDSFDKATVTFLPE
ncbi:MAG: leucine-rich repeat protein [Tenericutes bacterium]|nr:leucine-rich repeat protein [Mycoplasmatota bacterium]